MDYRKLFHEETAFQRETFEARMLDYGFKNIGRMELFLWDLEGDPDGAAVFEADHGDGERTEGKQRAHCRDSGFAAGFH